MKKFYINISLFCLIMICFAYTLQWVIDFGLEKSYYSSEYKEWYEIYHSKVDADIVIQGSSRAFVHFSPRVMETALHCKVYNLGMDGQALPMQMWRFNQYIKNNRKPKILIQQVDVNLFNDPVIAYEFKQFIPYLNPEFQNRFRGKSFFKKPDFYVPLYKYTHTDGAAVAGLVNVFNKEPRENGKYKGFKSISKNWNEAFMESMKKGNPNGFNVNVDAKAYSLFFDLINRCELEGIQLILVYSPVHTSLQQFVLNKDSIVDLFRAAAEQHHLKYFDYSSINMCEDSRNFYDANHLNFRGVEKFNQLLVSDLVKVIKL